jgi:hypothetical protein
VARRDGRGSLHRDTAASQLGLTSTRFPRPGLLESICEAYGRQSQNLMPSPTEDAEEIRELDSTFGGLRNFVQSLHGQDQALLNSSAYVSAYSQWEAQDLVTPIVEVIRRPL